MVLQMEVVGVDSATNQPMHQTVHCPNCGSSAEREYLEAHHLVRLQCSHCDYLMVTCAQTGNVREAYAPGLSA